MTLNPQSPVAGMSVLITGGAVGLGRSFAHKLAHAGAVVTICDLRPDVEDTARDLRARGLNVQAVEADVSAAPDVQRAVTAALENAGSIDVLINNAGVVRVTDPLDTWDKALDDYEHVIGTNLKGIFMFGRAVAPIMAAKGSGHIVNVATDHIHTCGWPDVVGHGDSSGCPWNGERRRPGWVQLDLYDASKWALNGLTQNWARSLRQHGVRVNSLCMGATDSFMQREFFGFDYADNEPPSALLETWIDPERLADIVIELIEEGPDGRSGDNIGVWMGHPTVLPKPSAVLNLSPDFTPDVMTSPLITAMTNVGQ